MKLYTIEKRVNNTTIFYKVSYDCLSEKQKNHLGIKKIKIERAKYLNGSNNTENIDKN